MAVPLKFLGVFFLLFSGALVLVVSEETFDIRRHVSTATRYEMAKARHGTRAPTKKKMTALVALETRLGELVENVKGQKSDVIPGWLRGWRSPFTGKHKGGELISQGETEMYELGVRTREKFPELFKEEYHPDVYPIKATQVSRASASAVAFGMGLFSGRGYIGPGRHRAFAVTSESRASDIWLRFHDHCQNYKAFRKCQEPAVEKLKEPMLNEITQELVRQWGLNFSNSDVSALWFLCKQEASLLNKTDQACALFSPSQAALLEWTDDLEVFVLKGYGNSLNYRMGIPLLNDVIHSMEEAIKANKDGLVPGSYEMAKLRFAHAETLLPFSCLIGLFLDEAEFEQILQEKPLQLPPKPPQKRIWHGSTVAPFAGNNMLVLYSCPENNVNKYFVQVLHNERPIPLAGCGNSDFCPFEMFKDKIVAPHLKLDYDAVCTPEQMASSGIFSRILHWIFPANAKLPPKTEL